METTLENKCKQLGGDWYEPTLYRAVCKIPKLRNTLIFIELCKQRKVKYYVEFRGFKPALITVFFG